MAVCESVKLLRDGAGQQAIICLPKVADCGVDGGPVSCRSRQGGPPHSAVSPTVRRAWRWRVARIAGAEACAVAALLLHTLEARLGVPTARQRCAAPRPLTLRCLLPTACCLVPTAYRVSPGSIPAGRRSYSDGGRKVRRAVARRYG
jgi:hypothetical protein